MITQKVELTPLDLNNSDHLGVMFRVRTHPAVCACMPGNPPKNFLEHTQYLYNVKNKVFFIIHDSDHLYGYCQATFHPDEIELGWAIEPSCWGQGIGKQSVEQLLDVVRPHNKKIILYVQTNNERALGLYQKYGFEMTQTMEDGIRYKMELKDASSS